MTTTEPAPTDVTTLADELCYRERLRVDELFEQACSGRARLIPAVSSAVPQSGVARTT